MSNSMKGARQKLTGFKRSHAFVIGIDRYPAIEAHLTTAVRDAARIAEVLWQQQDFDQVWLLKNTSKTELVALLEWLREEKGDMKWVQPKTDLDPELLFKRSHMSMLCEWLWRHEYLLQTFDQFSHKQMKTLLRWLKLKNLRPDFLLLDKSMLKNIITDNEPHPISGELNEEELTDFSNWPELERSSLHWLIGNRKHLIDSRAKLSFAFSPEEINKVLARMNSIHAEAPWLSDLEAADREGRSWAVDLTDEEIKELLIWRKFAPNDQRSWNKVEESDLYLNKISALIFRELSEKYGRISNLFSSVKEVEDTNSEVSGRVVRYGTDASVQQISAEDCLVFYYAGHGQAEEYNNGPAGYLIPSDAQPLGGRLLNDSLLPMEEVLRALSLDEKEPDFGLNCRHTLLILDCCFAGKFRHVKHVTRGRTGRSHGTLYQERFEKYRSRAAWQVLVSSGPDQTAADWLGERDIAGQIHSPFAEALFEALNGKADEILPGKLRGDGVLVASEIKDYVFDIVLKKTKEHESFQPQHPDIFSMSGHSGGQFIFLDPTNAKNLNELNLPLLGPRNPYRGLKAFEKEDYEHFFGRLEAIDTLLGRLEEIPAVVIIGQSGVGKSSLAKAGLFPALRETKDYELIILRPGEQPWSGTIVEESQGPSKVSETQNAGSETENNPAKSYWSGLQHIPLETSKEQVLLIDQYEQLFLECKSEEERTQFETKLKLLLNEAYDGLLKIIITLRSDFEWLFRQSDFGKRISSPSSTEDTAAGPDDTYYHKQVRYWLSVPDEGNLRKMIEEPARKDAFEFEEGLVDEILEDLDQGPGALPLMSFTMQELYRKADKDIREFKKSDYKTMGGVIGALKLRADDVYDNLTGEGLTKSDLQGMMRLLFLRMVNIRNGSYTRRRVLYLNREDATQIDKLDELNFPHDHQDDLRKTVITQLTDAQLIIRGHENGKSFIEPAHDALIKEWDNCKEWIADFGEANILLQHQLWQAVLDYHHPQTEPDGSIRKGSNPTDEDETKPSAPKASYLWDSNPKLQQLLDLIMDPKDVLSEVENDRVRTFVSKIWNDNIAEDELVEAREVSLKWIEDQQILRNTEETKIALDRFQVATPDKLFDLLIEHGKHWLNEAEKDFIKKSWQERKGQIERLTRQRNDANHSLAKLYEERAGNSLKEEAFLQAWLYNLAALNQEVGNKRLPIANGRLMLPSIRPDTKHRKGVEEKTHTIWCMDVHEELGFYALGASGFKIELINFNDGSKIRELAFEPKYDKDKAIKYSYSFKNEATSTNPVNIIWDISIHPSGKALAFTVSSNDGNMIKAGDLNPQSVFKYIYIWDLTARTEHPSVNIRYMGPRVNCLAYNAAGDKLAVGLSGRTIIFPVQVENGQVNYDLGKLMNSAGKTTNCLHFDRSGKYLFSGHDNGSILQIDLQEQRSELLGKRTSEIKSMTELFPTSVSEQSGQESVGLIAVGEAGRKISIWDFKKKSLIDEWEAHSGSVAKLAGNDPGDLLISASANTLCFWDWQNETQNQPEDKTRLPAAQIITSGSIDDLYFNTREASLLVGTIDKKLHEFNLFLNAFGAIDNTFSLVEFIKNPWKLAYKKYLKNLYAKSLEELYYKLEDSTLKITQFARMLEADQKYFGGEKIDADRYKFIPKNLTVLTNTAAQEQGFPKFDKNLIVLTPDEVNSVASTVFLKTEVIPPFTIEFDYRIVNRGGAFGMGDWRTWPADGFVFIFLKDAGSAGAEIPGGSSRGFISDGKGYGVHFATFDKNTIFITNGFGTQIATPDGRLPKPVFTDGAWRKVKIIVNESLIIVEYEGEQILNLEGSLDLSYRNIGFSSANGQANAEHSIRNIQVTK